MVLSLSCASSTVLPKSRSLTLNKTLPRSMAFSLFIIGGPSLIFISATASKGIGPNSMVCTCSFFKSSILFLYSCAYLAFTEKRCLPSIVVVNVIPPIAASTTLFTSSMLRPYLPIASRFASISIYFPPVIGSAYKSFTPSVPSSVFLIFCAKASMVSKLAP